jgi:hypothetical protein
MRSPFDDLPIRRRSARLPVVLTGVVVVAIALVQLLGAGPFFSFDSARDCTASITQDGHVLADDPVIAVVGSSQSAFPCSEHVTLAPVSDPASVRTGAQHAVREGGPLLVVGATLDDAVAEEIARLAPDTVTVVGNLGQALDQVEALDVDVRRMEADPQALTPTAAGDSGGPVFVVDSGVDAALPAIEAIATETGGKVLVAHDVELTDLPDAMRLVIEQASALRMVGGFDPSSAWHVELIRSDTELPGGGTEMFPGRRLVGFYGSPLTGALGILGEQGPSETADRMGAYIADYDADGVPVVATFEIIATVASAAPGSDGDYSDEVSVESLRPWVDYAGKAGMYVVIDLQPGRSDFLSQAQRYEELLRLPHVGLALDPEWRLGPDQLHLEQIGTVDAAEINEVAEWLAELVREEVIPQKLLLLHQFRESMITNRDSIVSPDELAVVIQMDGQGVLAAKLESWNTLTRDWNAGSGYLWGWKNFFDEDEPMATPAQVIGLEPTPVFISFQ